MKIPIAAFLTLTLLAFGCNSGKHPDMTAPLDKNNTNNEEPIASATPTNTLYEPTTVLVSFKPGTPEMRIRQIAAEVGGSINHPLDNRTVYTVTLDNPAADGSSVPAAVNKLKAYPEVEISEQNSIITVPDCSTGPC